MPRTGAGSTRGPASRRGRRDLTRFVLWHSFLDSSGGRFRPTQLQYVLAGVGGCPGPHTVRWKWHSGLLVPLHDPVGVQEHYCSTEGSCWSLCAALSCQSACHVMSCDMCLFARSPWRPPQTDLSQSIRRPRWWQQVRRQMRGGERQGHSCMRVHDFAAAVLVSQLTKPEHLLHRLRPCTAGCLSALFLCDWEMSLDLCVHCKQFWWGVYSVRRAPDDWPDVATLIDNNYRNMHARDVKTKGREAADEESVPFLGATLPTVLIQFLDSIVSVCRLTDLDPVMEEYASRVAYCIPILANAAVTYDVSIQQTPEMQKEAGSIG